MGIELILICVALFAVVITMGSFRKLFSTHFSHVWTLGLVVAGYLALQYAPIEKSQYDSLGLGILLATYVLLFGFCAANLDKRGMWIVLVGTACNALVIGLNKGMPVTTSGDFHIEETIKHQAATNNDLLPWLSDIFPIDALSIAFSIGDAIFALGIVTVCVAASRKTKKNKEEQVETANEAEKTIEDDVEDALEQIAAYTSNPATDEVPIVIMEEQETISIAENEEDTIIDLTHEEQVAILEAQQNEREDVEGNTKQVTPKSYKGTKRMAKKRSSRRWQKSHGLNALPSKEELGYDDTSMQIVEAAE